MNFGTPPQNQWSAFSQLGEKTAAIDQECRSILKLLKEALERDSILGKNVCSIELTDSESEFAKLESPIGNGRIVRSWRMQGREIQGELVFQREQRDQYDRTFWEPVWGLVVPLYEAPYSGTGASALRFELDAYPDDKRNKAFAAVMSMLYGLLNGPAKAIGYSGPT